MSATSNSTVEQSARSSWSPCGHREGRASNWSGVHILAMVLGFMMFWPVGLFMVYWIMTGRHISELPAAARRSWARAASVWQGGSSSFVGAFGAERSDNTVFDRFQQTQYDRISEIRDEIRERARRFSEFRTRSRQRADEEEFNQFMASSPERKGN